MHLSLGGRYIFTHVHILLYSSSIPIVGKAEILPSEPLK